jgi:hypothetical protein
MSAINLNKGLEALYYFDEQNFDSQRNLLRDHSGYARHAKASGGPAVGVEGPDDFGATSFDGSDDYFQSDLDDNDTGLTAFLVADISNQERAIAFGSGNFAGSGQPDSRGWTIRPANNTVEFRLVDSNGNYNQGSIETSPGYNSYFIRWDGEKATYRRNKDIAGIRTVESRNLSLEPLSVGYYGPLADYVNMDVAVAGLWYRGLNDAEIAHLNRLTAPRRAQL